VEFKRLIKNYIINIIKNIDLLWWYYTEWHPCAAQIDRKKGQEQRIWSKARKKHTKKLRHFISTKITLCLNQLTMLSDPATGTNSEQCWNLQWKNVTTVWSNLPVQALHYGMLACVRACACDCWSYYLISCNHSVRDGKCSYSAEWSRPTLH
jgi:hypothetical protein